MAVLRSWVIRGEKILEVKRVPYGKRSTPLKDREFKIKGLPESPVGNIDEFRKWAGKHGYHKVRFEDFDKTFERYTEEEGK